MRYSGFDHNDEKNFLELTKKGVAATFIYSTNVCYNGKLFKFDENNRDIRTIAISDIVLVPITFFSEILALKVSGRCGKTTIINGEQKVELKTCECAYKVNGESKLFAVAPKVIDKVIYVPAIDVATSLGFAAGSFYENRLVAVGPKKEIDELYDNKALSDAASYVIFGEYDAT